MRGAIEIRRLTSANTALLDSVAVDVFDAFVDPERLARYVAAPGHFMFVALDGGQVVGQIAAVMHDHPDKPSELYVDEIGVSPAWQRQGIARRMLDAMQDLARAEGAVEVWVGTEPGNEAAKALYSSRAEGEPFLMYAWDI